MRLITDINAYEGKAPSVVTLGKFDGLHRGHQKLIDRVCQCASSQMERIVCAFDMGRESLLTVKERQHRLEGRADWLIVCPFTKELKEMEAEAFLREILVKKFHAACIVAGPDFRFGYEKRGNVSMLERYARAYGFHLEVVEKERYKGREISSTYVKEKLLEGDMEEANALLGYRYFLSGKVEHGAQLGRTLGFPTMNFIPDKEKTVPRFGVYACDVLVDGVRYHGIGNVGMKPTVAKKPQLLTEVFLFDYHGDAYGKEITVEFCAFERPEQKFSSVEELKARVEEDIRFGQRYFA